MATKTEVRLVDDLTGEAADTTVKFALDGTDYELDLSDKNVGEMRETFAKYVIAARKVAGGGRRGGRASKPTFAEVDPAAVRAWAAARGVAVSPRGRISKDVIEKYRAAGN